MHRFYENLPILLVTIQHLQKSVKQSLLLGVSARNVGGMDADTSLHGCIHDVFLRICPVAVTVPNVLNSYFCFSFTLLPYENLDQ